jgi:hypothetical protein
MSNDAPVCPKCGSKKTKSIYYSCPAQADCLDCGYRYEFGEGIKVLGLKEAITRRPKLYEEYRCHKCGKYNLGIENYHLKEDKNLICLCPKTTKENS